MPHWPDGWGGTRRRAGRMAEPPALRVRIRRTRRRVQVCARRHLPPGVRLVAGLLLMLGGVFGFLPVIGFWMLPLGAAVAALDIVPLWRWLRARLKGRDESR